MLHFLIQTLCQHFKEKSSNSSVVVEGISVRKKALVFLGKSSIFRIVAPLHVMCEACPSLMAPQLAPNDAHLVKGPPYL